MQNIQSTYFIKQDFTTTFNSTFRTVTNWAGYTIRWLSDLPIQMKNQPRVALAVFATANLVFFTLMNIFANYLEERVHSSPQKLDRKNRMFNNFLIDVIVVGSSSLFFNFLFSKLTSYPLSKKTLGMITLVTIVVRSFLHSVEEDDQ